jgi:hypothetical protein
MKLPNSLRALAHRNFRLFLIGQGTAQIGNWIQLVATSWLVYRLSGSTVMLGLSAFALQIPLLLITPFAGVLIDRLDVRRVLYATNGLAMLQSLSALMRQARCRRRGVRRWTSHRKANGTAPSDQIPPDVREHVAQTCVYSAAMFVRGI